MRSLSDLRIAYCFSMMYVSVDTVSVSGVVTGEPGGPATGEAATDGAGGEGDGLTRFAADSSDDGDTVRGGGNDDGMDTDSGHGVSPNEENDGDGDSLLNTGRVGLTEADGRAEVYRAGCLGREDTLVDDDIEAHCSCCRACCRGC
jgi:hypothetical protein